MGYILHLDSVLVAVQRNLSWGQRSLVKNSAIISMVKPCLRQPWSRRIFVATATVSKEILFFNYWMSLHLHSAPSALFGTKPSRAREF